MSNEITIFFIIKMGQTYANRQNGVNRTGVVLFIMNGELTYGSSTYARMNIVI